MIDNFANNLFMQRMTDEENTRIKTNARNWKYYKGEHKKPLRVKPGQPDDNVILNLSRLVVDKGVSFLFGKQIEFRPDEGEQTDTEDFVDEAWEANAKMTLLQSFAINGGVTGHCFAKLIPQGIEYNGQQWTRIVSLDPSIVRVFWDGDDLSRVLWYRIQYEMATPQGAVIKKQIIERAESGAAWLITDYISRDGGVRWEQVGEVQTWAYDFPPIIDWQNLPAPNEYYGSSDLESIPELNDSINFVASDINRILKYHAHPRTWGNGFSAKEINTGVDDMIIVPNPNAKIQNLEMQSDLSASRAYMADLTSWLLRIARIPNVDPATVNVGALSGFALKILYGDLLEKTETKRRLYGDAIKEINRRLQILDGRAPTKYTIVWQTPLPDNRIEQVQQLDAELNRLGTTSKATAAQELGRTWEIEQERKAQEATQTNNIGATLLRAFEQGQGLQ